jgi:hypothetical protein
MTKFTIEIDCGNAAFGDDDAEVNDEVARILRRAAELLQDSGTQESIVLRDINGNRVGSAKFEDQS